MKLFRRNRHDHEGGKPASDAGNNANPSSSQDILPPHSAPSISDSVTDPGAIWYKRPRDTGSVNLAQEDNDIRSHFSHPTNVGHTAVPSSSRSTVTTGSRRKTTRKKEGYPPRDSKKERGFFHRKKKKNGSTESKITTNVLIASLISADWQNAASHIDAEPALVRQQDVIDLHGSRTMALPLHIACCVQTPPALFDQIVDAFAEGAQHTDEVMGRLPLHWACMSQASTHVLQKLIQVFPDACKSIDLTDGRTPLHHLIVHANRVDQLQPLLRAPVNQKRIMKQKDKQGKIPLDLAKCISSPIKEDLIAALMNHEQSAASDNRRRKQTRRREDISSVPELTYEKKQSSKPVLLDGASNAARSRDVALKHSHDISPVLPRSKAATAQSEEKRRGNIHQGVMTMPQKRIIRTRYEYPKHRIDVSPPDQEGRIVGEASKERRDRRYPTRSAVDTINGLPDPPASKSQGIKRSPVKQNTDTCLFVDLTTEDHKEGIETFDLQQFERRNVEAYIEGNRVPLSNENNDQNQTSAQSMMDEMLVTMSELEDSIGKLQTDLHEKETDMTNLEVVATEIAMREQDLMLGLDNARSVVEHQYKKVNQKRETIELLKDKIATLQAELMREESILYPMEKTILLLEQKVLDKEQKLEDHREEKASFEAMRLAIMQEKDGLTRNLENSNSELQSLKVIQNLAKGEEAD